MSKYRQSSPTAVMLSRCSLQAFVTTTGVSRSRSTADDKINAVVQYEGLTGWRAEPGHSERFMYVFMLSL